MTKFVWFLAVVYVVVVVVATHSYTKCLARR